jgi:hypothetical protein
VKNAMFQTVVAGGSVILIRKWKRQIPMKVHKTAKVTDPQKRIYMHIQSLQVTISSWEIHFKNFRT